MSRTFPKNRRQQFTPPTVRGQLHRQPKAVTMVPRELLHPLDKPQDEVVEILYDLQFLRHRSTFSTAPCVLVNRFPCPSSGDVTCLFTVTYGSLRGTWSQLLSETALPENHRCPNQFLPNRWSRHVKSALLCIISLARLACVHTWAWAAGIPAPLSMSEWLAGQPTGVDPPRSGAYGLVEQHTSDQGGPRCSLQQLFPDVLPGGVTSFL